MKKKSSRMRDHLRRKEGGFTAGLLLERARGNLRPSKQVRRKNRTGAIVEREGWTASCGSGEKMPLKRSVHRKKKQKREEKRIFIAGKHLTGNKVLMALGGNLEKKKKDK